METPAPTLEQQLSDLRIELHKEKCLRIKAESCAIEISISLGEKIAGLKLQLAQSKKNWWRRFRLPKLVWRDEYDES